MADQVAAICRSAYFQLCQLWRITWSLLTDAAKAVVQAFVMCHLDYCSLLLYGITDGLIHRLQSAQNAAACLVSGTHRHNHIVTVLQQLHWLPIRQRAEFELTLLVYKAIHALLSPFLTSDCQLITAVSCRHLHCSDVLGDRCFQSAAARLWNRLHPLLLQPDVTYRQFIRQPKSHLFCRDCNTQSFVWHGGIISYLLTIFRAINSLPNKTCCASRHFRRCYLTANKVSKSEGTRKLSKNIIFESVLMMFAKCECALCGDANSKSKVALDDITLWANCCIRCHENTVSHFHLIAHYEIGGEFFCDTRCIPA